MTSLAILVVVVVSGCSRTEPTLAGGKPLDHWLDAIKDADPKTRRTAVVKLGNAGLNERGTFAAVVAALKDSDVDVRCEAILAILKFGAQTQEATPDLADLHQHDVDDKVRAYAGKALKKLQDSKGI
jgi:HEAT repeat protein